MPPYHDNPAQAAVTTDSGARDVYFSLLEDPSSNLPKAREWLQYQLAAACHIPVDMPADLELLPMWSTRRAGEVEMAFQSYLMARRSGAPRRLFPERSAALWFLRASAPARLVEGAWLYGMLPHHADPDHVPLIRAYLERLGHGVADKNHSVVYRKLLEKLRCDNWDDLDDRYFVQGAIQLCLGYNPTTFLPEVIGYHLGREQWPLHLLLTQHELNELGIDSYYFTLQVKPDQSVAALRQLLPHTGDREAFLRRMGDGFKLNDLGANCVSIIAAFHSGADARCGQARNGRQHQLPGDPADGIRALEEISTLSIREDVMKKLAGLVSPARHHTPVGLMAARMYSAMLGC